MYRQAAAVSSGVKIHLSRRLFVGCLLLALLLFAGLFATWHNREVADESESTDSEEVDVKHVKGQASGKVAPIHKAVGGKRPADETDEGDDAVGIPPTRAPGTKRVPNPAGELPACTDAKPFSIVIVDFNEKLLAKTVDEVLKVRSADLICEVLIIDDKSDKPVRYESMVADARVNIHRAVDRLGLIRARIDGSNIAAGKFMVLIDAHCKPHDDWLVPISKLLHEDHKRVINMEVGLLDGEKWTEMPGNAIGSKAGFLWTLSHFWEPFMDVNTIKIVTSGGDTSPDPDQSPITMGMFATTKRWWTTIGGMDTDLSTWGGENIEISLRTWLCGGEIRVARGSRIDHAFRTKFPYTVDGGLYRRNLVRIAEAWMDLKSRQKFYKASGILPGSVPFGSIDEQLATQKRLKCKPFAWYLKKFANRSPIDKTP